MTDNENFSNSLQENLIILLCFNNEKAQLIINNIKPNLFSNPYYRNIIKKATDFIHEFKETPQNHLPDLLEDDLSDPKNGEIYKKILLSLEENKDSINIDYVISELEKFIKLQNTKLTIKEAYEALQRDDLEKAEDILSRSRKIQISTFDAGTFLLSEKDKTLSFFEKLDSSNFIYTGIKELDELDICPAPKELFVMLGRSGVGKSWGLNHLAKYAMVQRKKILHITLELDDERVKSRYMQTLFGITSKNIDLQNKNVVFKTDRFGNLADIGYKDIMNIKSLKDKDIVDYLYAKMEEFYQPKLIVKYFPSGTLSISNLEAYLDNLEGYYNFIPDIILLDYLDLMEMDTDKLRLDLGYTAVALRGIAGERNLAMVTVSQTNAAAEGKKLITRKNSAEDFSRVRVADNFLTINSTSYEHELGLMRLFCDKVRNAKDNLIILCSQNLSLGQFCLNSCRITSKYFDMLGENEK